MLHCKDSHILAGLARETTLRSLGTRFIVSTQYWTKICQSCVIRHFEIFVQSDDANLGHLW